MKNGHLGGDSQQAAHWGEACVVWCGHPSQQVIVIFEGVSFTNLKTLVLYLFSFLCKIGLVDTIDQDPAHYVKPR